jgi:hypothetical protein
MARKKTNKILGTFKIFFSSIKTYFLYLEQCLQHLSFPILGQIFSLVIIFTIVYYYNSNIENIRNISPFFDNSTNLLFLLWVIILPFFILFVKAVYDYIIAFCAFNLLFYTASNKKKAKDIDFSSHKNVIDRKLFKYIILMLVVTFLLTIPPLIFISPLLWIFLCLTFQVFSFENDLSVPKIISRSMTLVKDNVISTIIMLLLCSILTYWFLPELFIWVSEKISLNTFLIGRFEVFVSMFDLESLNKILSIVKINIDSLTIAKILAESIISFVVITYTLPFRCCCFTQLYKLFDDEKIKDISKESDEIITRATGKKRKN